MEKLLNVRQAAELLNVSQMTVRRWTNDGLLACFRIGKKRERRFQLSDIHQFIEGNPPSPRTDKTLPDKPEHHVALDFNGLDVADLIRQNRLIHGSGRKTPAEMVEYIFHAAASARDRFRLIGDMSWTFQKKWSEENLRTLEESTNTRLGPGTLFLCQYSLAEFFGTQTMIALETHACALYKGKLQKNLLQKDG